MQKRELRAEIGNHTVRDLVDTGARGSPAWEDDTHDSPQSENESGLLQPLRPRNVDTELSTK